MKTKVTNKKKQTAVDWLYEAINNEITDYLEKRISLKELRSGIRQARKKAQSIQKEQIIGSWIATDNELQRLAAEKYYKENFEMVSLMEECDTITSSGTICPFCCASNSWNYHLETNKMKCKDCGNKI